MLTETWIVNPKIVNETKFQYTNAYSSQIGNLLPQVNVAGAFTSGGANAGNNNDRSEHFELQNNTSNVHGTHTLRYGLRARRESDRSMSPGGFGGVFSFLGGSAPVLDPNFNIQTDSTGNPVTTTLSAVAQYTRTLMLQKAGFTPSQIRALGGGASQFSIDQGNPYSSIVQYDLALFAQDDWRVRPNPTVSYGVRYEWQINLNGSHDAAPGRRLGARNGQERPPKDRDPRRLRHVLRPRRGKPDRTRLAARRQQPAFLYPFQSGHVSQRSRRPPASPCNRTAFIAWIPSCAPAT